MTGKADFTDEEWQDILQGPPTAGMIVVTAERGGMFRESISMAKAYTGARAEHGESQLLDEIAATKPEIDRTRYHSLEELKEHGLKHLGEIIELPGRQGDRGRGRPVQALRLTLAQRVAEAHKEGFRAERRAGERCRARRGERDRRDDRLLAARSGRLVDPGTAESRSSVRRDSAADPERSDGWS